MFAVVSGAEYELATGATGNLSWRSENSWYVNKGSAKELYPTADDDVKIVPQHDTSNFCLHLQLPTGSEGDTIEINSLAAEIGASKSLLGSSGVAWFVVKNDFKKVAETENKDGKTVGVGQGGMVFGPNSLKSYLHLKIGGSVFLSDMAEDRTSNMVFGGSSYWGGFNTGHLLASFEIENDLNILNTMVFVGTENGVNATVRGSVRFDPPVNGRHATLLLNSDNGDEAWQELQTIRVGGLSSEKPGSGLVATRTGGQRFPTEEELKRLPADFKSDDKIRNGNLEIIGAGGVYSGEIRDNLRQEDKRGMVSVTMNSTDGKQSLIGGNSYTGTTYVLAGALILNAASPLSKVDLQGGSLSLLGDSPAIKELLWEGGIFKFDFTKNRTVKLAGDCKISINPDVKLPFEFSNIKPRKTYALFRSENQTDFFNETFGGKRLDAVDAETGLKYEAVFAASETSLSVLFILKQ